MRRTYQSQLVLQGRISIAPDPNGSFKVTAFAADTDAMNVRAILIAGLALMVSMGVFGYWAASDMQRINDAKKAKASQAPQGANALPDPTAPAADPASPETYQDPAAQEATPTVSPESAAGSEGYETPSEEYADPAYDEGVADGSTEYAEGDTFTGGGAGSAGTTGY
jgi:hypothetical protein